MCYIFLQVGLGIFLQQTNPNLHRLLNCNVFSKLFHRRTQSQIVYICLFSPQCLFSNETSNRQPSSGVHCQCPSAHTNCKALVGGWWMRLRPSVSVSLLCSECGAAACGGRNVHGSQTGCRALVGALQSSSASSGQSVGDQLVARQPFQPPSRVNCNLCLPLCPGGGRE